MRFMKTWLIVLAFCSIQIGGIVGCSNPVQTNREKDTIFVVKNSTGEDTEVKQLVKIYSFDTTITLVPGPRKAMNITFPITVSKNYIGLAYYQATFDKNNTWTSMDNSQYASVFYWGTNYVNIGIGETVTIRIVLFDQI